MRCSILLAAVLLAVPADVSAQPTSIAHQAGEPWLHEPTAIGFPAAIGDLTRTDVRWFSAPDVDVAAIYANADQSEIITLYLFRNVSADVPVWFDRARTAILARRELFGEVTPGGISAFIPRGQEHASGLLESYRTTGQFSATALAVLPVKSFYAKVRVSSARKDPAALEAMVRQLLNGINWASDRPEAAASAVADCPSPLAFRKRAKQVGGSNEDRMMSGLLGGLLAQISPADSKAKPVAPPPTFCREPGPAQVAMGVYRPNASSERYMLAVGDAGQAVVVGRNELAELVAKSKRPRYSVSLVRLDQTASFADYADLPSPQQVVEIVGSSRPTSVAPTWGAKRNTINIEAR